MAVIKTNGGSLDNGTGTRKWKGPEQQGWWWTHFRDKWEIYVKDD